MSYFPLHSGFPASHKSVSVNKQEDISSRLLPVLRERDLVFILVLNIFAIYNVQEMQSSGLTLFLNWLITFVTLVLPCFYVFGWLVRQAHPRVPIYYWATRLLNKHWSSFLLFLICWPSLLSVLGALYACLYLLIIFFPLALSNILAQWLVFIGLLTLATLLTCLPFRFFRRVLGFCAFFYIVFFVLLGITAMILLISRNAAGDIFSLAAHSKGAYPTSLPTFSLTAMAIPGLSLPFLMKRASPDQVHRRSISPLWWAVLLSFGCLLLASFAFIVIETARQGDQISLFQIPSLVFGPGANVVVWFLLFSGAFGIALVYLLTFSHLFLLSLHQDYLSNKFIRLNRYGVPVNLLLIQSLMVAFLAFLLFVVIPVMFGWILPDLTIRGIVNTHRYDVFIAVGDSLWSFSSSLIFLFVFWLFCKKYRRRGIVSRRERILLPVMCLSGFLTSLIYTFTPFVCRWYHSPISPLRWMLMVWIFLLFSLLFAGIMSELPRRATLLREKEKGLVREKALRKELEQVYNRECDLHKRLQESYDEQQISILQQKLLLDEVNRLYREEEQVAITDPVTDLFNHRAFIQRLDEEIASCQSEQKEFLVLFLDIDYFKEVNDTWGHQAGDMVLREIGRRLRANVRPQDLVSRYGGEEFALLLPGRSVLAASEQADHLRKAVNLTPYYWNGTDNLTSSIHLTASIGVAAYGLHGTQREELIERADLAMYQAKMAGRNCVRVADLEVLSNQTKGIPSRYLHRDEESLTQSEKEATLVYSQVVLSLSAMMHARDCTTDLHSQRLIHLAEETGKQLKVSCQDLLLIRLGARLHDIGKVGVPDTILNKGGPLGEEEWKIMHRHPEIGAQILAQVGGIFQNLAPIVAAHHERWDGDGYPLGLQGADIPLLARILSVVDAYDAMVSRRPYKEPIPAAEARAELRRCAGTQFDASVVDALLVILGTLEQGESASQPRLRQILEYPSKRQLA